MGYGTRELARGSIIDSLAAKLPLHGAPFVFDLPPGDVETMGGRPYVVVRPVTIRREWHNPARNPDPSSLLKVAQWLQDAGYLVVLVADLKEGEEHSVGALPPYDVAYLRGEKNVVELMALVRGAAAVVGGVGWVVPMAIAAGTPLFVVQGGQLGHNGPDKITDPRMNLSRVGWAKPRYPCQCERMNHNCRKDPADLKGDFVEWMERCGLNDPNP
jgi:ADP-heptose:LPS heptosyltransferase